MIYVYILSCICYYMKLLTNTNIYEGVPSLLLFLSTTPSHLITPATGFSQKFAHLPTKFLFSFPPPNVHPHTK